MVFYFETSIGSWSLKAYKGYDDDGNELTTLYTIGVVYHIIFIMLNLVLMFNFIIAILSGTYAKYESI